jgi:ubiquinone biosynthesis monooxygenase Coq7
MALGPADRLIKHFDAALKSVTGTVGTTRRPSPAKPVPENDLSSGERALSASLMRVNHCGEVCAQALYNGQALTARSSRTANSLKIAAEEETDHLSWCEERIEQLDSHVSYLNPFWYGASFTMGAIAGLLGDKINLGFVAATEEEVCRHLDSHLEKLPAADEKSRQILARMREDEARHAASAMESGGAVLPKPVKMVMRSVSRLMTQSSYWI